uniref:Piwi domain-containing protein n=1 Tax=Strongyloides papillosus TaxID=174720 RepID=A0A0N5CEX3_STREA
MYLIAINSDPVYCPKKAPGSAGRTVKLFTNYFGLKLGNTQGTVVYQYEIEIIKILNNGKKVIVNKKREAGAKTNDYLEQMSRRSLVALWPAFHEVLEKHQIARPASSITDFNRILYMLDPIHVNFTDEDKKNEFFTLSLDKADFPDKVVSSGELKDVEKLEYNIRFTNEFEAADSIFSDNVLDRDGVQYLALLLSMKMSLDKENISIYENGKNYLTRPLNHGFKESDIPELHGGKRLGIGSQKSVKLIEGSKGEAGISLAIDTKRTAFHEPMLLSDKFNALLANPRGGVGKFTGANVKKVIDNMKGLACHCVHLKNRIVIVSNISTETAISKKIAIDGKNCSVADYYKMKYNITLRNPDLPLVVQKKIFKGNKEECYYPMELLKVAEFQRVRQNAQTPEQISAMIRQCATAPCKRLSEIHNLFSAFQLTSNEYLKEASITVEGNVLAATGRQLKPPTLLCSNNKSIDVTNQNGSWELGRDTVFNVPSNISNWCAVLIQGNGRFDVNMKTADTFIKMYVKTARVHGVKITDCAEICQCPSNEKELVNLFDYLKKHKTGFVLFMTPDSVTYLHNIIKLYERQYGIPTQDLKHSTVSKTVEKNQFKTLENIIMKSNVKKGGHNFDLKNVIKPDRMIMGIGFNHTISGGEDSLSVVGYAANTRKIPSEFAGDVHYIQFARDGKIEFYDKVIQNTVKNFKASRGISPKEIFIYRTSGSEGRYNDYCTYEIPYIKAKIKQYAPGAKLVFIVVEKAHNVRFFKDKINPTDKAPFQNVAPGSVVDTGITNPKLCEFFLTSHSGLQGTAKTPKYVILYDDLNVKMDELEGLTNSLAYGYQIVSLPTSLPAPVYIANQYAERGRNILNANNTKMGPKKVIQDEESANEALSYTTTIFNNVRINA